MFLFAVNRLNSVAIETTLLDLVRPTLPIFVTIRTSPRKMALA